MVRICKTPENPFVFNWNDEMRVMHVNVMYVDILLDEAWLVLVLNKA